MAINLTDSLNAATTKGKLAEARQVFLDGDERNVQQAIEGIETDIKNITGGGGDSLKALRDAINNEATSRQTADSSLGERIDGLDTKVDNEIKDIKGGEDISLATLKKNIEDETKAREEALVDYVKGVDTAEALDYPSDPYLSMLEQKAKEQDAKIEENNKKQQALINEKQLEIGAMEFDTEPTEGSGHGITSGGVYDDLNKIIEVQNVTFSKKGFFIRPDGHSEDNTNWSTSDVFSVKSGDVLDINLKTTGFAAPFVFEKISDDEYIPLMENGTGDLKNYIILITKDCDIIMQCFADTASASARYAKILRPNSKIRAITNRIVYLNLNLDNLKEVDVTLKDDIGKITNQAVLISSTKPNFNTTSREIEFTDNTTYFLCGSKIITPANYNVSYDFPNKSSHRLLVLDKETLELKIIVYTTVDISAKYYVIGYVNCNFTTSIFNFALMPFDFTIDGKELFDKIIDKELIFKRTGKFIQKNGSVGESANWSQTDVTPIKAGEAIIFGLGTTGSGVILAKANDDSTYTPLLKDSYNNELNLDYWEADENCNVIVQCWNNYVNTGLGYAYILNKNTVRIFKSILSNKDYINQESLDEELKPLFEYINSVKPADYVTKERERVYDILLERMNENVNFFTFNTDQHFGTDVVSEASSSNPKYVLQGLNSIKQLSKKIPFDCIVLGGDTAGYGGGAADTTKGIIDGINLMKNELSGSGAPVVLIPGNHDAFQNAPDMTAYGMYNTCNKSLRNTMNYHHEGDDNCDGYIDVADSKLRYIFVDTYTRNGRVEDYKKFLNDALNGMPDDYNAVVFSHNPLTPAFTGLKDGLLGSTEIDVFANPTDLTSILNPYSEKIIACICGHSHTDAWNHDKGILYIETTSACNHTKTKVVADNITPTLGTLGTATDTAFDIFIINQKEKTIEAIRYGVGCNRKWKYKDDIKMLEGYPQIIER